MKTRFHGTFIKPSVHTGLDKLGDFGDVLEPRTGADERADGKVKAVVIKEGECQGCWAVGWGV